MVMFNDFLRVYGNYIAAAIFIIAASTDGVDGYVARKTQQVTNMGKFLDPIADKLLVTAAIIALVQRTDLSAWVAMLILTREFAVTGLRLIAAGEGIVIAASNIAKLKTATQIFAISVMLLKNFPLSLVTKFPLDQYAMILAVIITVYSGYDYFAKNINVLKMDNK